MEKSQSNIKVKKLPPGYAWGYQESGDIAEIEKDTRDVVQTYKIECRYWVRKMKKK